jgi:hypothetical protein
MAVIAAGFQPVVRTRRIVAAGFIAPDQVGSSAHRNTRGGRGVFAGGRTSCIDRAPGGIVIEAVPQGWFSNSYRLQQPHGTVAELDVSNWREKAEFDVEGGHYRLYREGFASGAFVLERDGKTVARALKPSAFRARFQVEIGGRAFELRRGGWTSNFGVFDGERQVGSIRRAAMFTRRAIIDLPDAWPLAAQVFVFWLVLVIWIRDQAAS